MYDCTLTPLIIKVHCPGVIGFASFLKTSLISKVLVDYMYSIVVRSGVPVAHVNSTLVVEAGVAGILEGLSRESFTSK